MLELLSSDNCDENKAAFSVRAALCAIPNPFLTCLTEMKLRKEIWNKILRTSDVCVDACSTYSTYSTYSTECVVLPLQYQDINDSCHVLNPQSSRLVTLMDKNQSS